MSPRRTHNVQHVTLRLPGGEHYGLELGSEELAQWLAPDRPASPEAGGIPVQVEVLPAGNRVVVAMAPGELHRWLSRARLEVEARRPSRPEPVHDPSRGRGKGDPAEQLPLLVHHRDARQVVARHQPRHLFLIQIGSDENVGVGQKRVRDLDRKRLLARLGRQRLLHHAVVHAVEHRVVRLRRAHVLNNNAPRPQAQNTGSSSPVSGCSTCRPVAMPFLSRAR